MFDWTWLAAGLIITLAAVLQTTTGFGFALVSIPLLFTIYDAHLAIVVNMLSALFSQALLTFRCRGDIIRPVLRNFVLGSLAGLPLGVYCFLSFDTFVLKLLASTVILIFSVLLLARPNSAATARANQSGQDATLDPGQIAPTPQRLLGAIAGFFNGSISMAGPPIVLFLNYQAYPKETFRATVSAFAIIQHAITLSLYAGFGAFRPQEFSLFLTLLPFAWAGNRLGLRLFPRIPQQSFQRGVPALVMATALYAIVSSSWR